MKIKPKYIQVNCVEGDKADLRQAKAVLKYKPDIIIFEYPAGKYGPDEIFNKYSCDKKPIKKVDARINDLMLAAKDYPYAESDALLWENVKKLWGQGVNTQIYNIDSPKRMRKEFYLFQKPFSAGYPAVRKDWLFWVYLYLRDSYMTKNLKVVLDTYKIKKDPTVLIFLQSIHWEHVQFLMNNPSRKDVWKYYFGRFKNLKQTKDIENQIKVRSKILNEYWKENQIFY